MRGALQRVERLLGASLSDAVTASCESARDWADNGYTCRECEECNVTTEQLTASRLEDFIYEQRAYGMSESFLSDAMKWRESYDRPRARVWALLMSTFIARLEVERDSLRGVTS